MTITRLILVRHGETDENSYHYYLGHYDAELNDKGRKQLRVLTSKLKNKGEQIDVIYSSDLSRANESARMIGEEFQVKPLPVFSLRELNFGDWDCKTYEDIKLDDQNQLEMWVNNPYKTAPPNGESLLQLGERIDNWLQQICSTKGRNETILIVSHGGPIRWILSKWVMGDSNEFWKVEGVGHGKGIIIDFDQQTGIFTIVDRL
ncbi:histidine phosphatase family protein [Bacillus sp. BRMEA1]|uniref:histidine phosphatase family protein n=1 Tax=Neobacillus endophyticus TaxID=2738405 RepID=UPI0015674E15|nr:histidine phosphatase family protein [Neobacillus endophyticus]NRD79193.1 histidine phosphatase family protein [Neobacillus endophyticus]